MMVKYFSSPQWWKLVVTLASFLSLFLGTSLSYCSGVIHVALLDHFQEDPVKTAWLGSLFSCMFALAGPIASMMINLFSCRICVMTGALISLVGFAISSFVTSMYWLFFTYALLAGIGEGLMYTGSLVILGFYYRDQVSLAAGIGLAGCALGTFVFPPTTQILLDAYGLNGCFLMLGAIAFQSAVLGALMRPSRTETDLHLVMKSGRNLCQRILTSMFGQWKHVGAILQPSFVLLVISSCTFGMGNYITYLYLPDFLIVKGSTPQEASFLLAVVGIGGCFSRLLSGMAGSDPHIGPTVLYFGAYVIVGTLDFIIVPLSTFLGGKIVYSFMFGLYASVGWVLLNPMTMQIVGVKSLASAFGIVMFSCGFGALVGPPMAGLIAESVGRYREAFYFSGATFYCTAFCGIALTLLKSRVSDKELKSGDTALCEEERTHIMVDKTLQIDPVTDCDKETTLREEERTHTLLDKTLQIDPVTDGDDLENEADNKAQLLNML